jgi:uncharacterized protein (UPF0335 family)
MAFVGWVKKLFSEISEIEKSQKEIEAFQRIAVEDLKEYIHRIEKRLDSQDTTLHSVEKFQQVATEDLKRQILSIELRLDGVPNEGPQHLADIRSELANIKQGFDRQALSLLRLLDRIGIK